MKYSIHMEKAFSLNELADIWESLIVLQLPFKDAEQYNY